MERAKRRIFLYVNHLLLFYSGIGTFKKRRLTKLRLFVDRRLSGGIVQQLKSDSSHSTKGRNHHRNNYT